MGNIEIDFTNPSSVRAAIKKYGDLDYKITGINKQGEDVVIHISNDGLKLETYQSNGHVRVNYFDESGHFEGESFEGRWS